MNTNLQMKMHHSFNFSGLLIFIAIVIESPPGAFGSIIAFSISYHVHLLLLEFGSMKDPGE